MPDTVRCPRCRRPIDVNSIATSVNARCPLCGRSFEAVRFQPVDKTVMAAQPVDGQIAATQPCANHPRNAAVTNCQRCGAFMCALCRIDVDGRTLCPSCFERLSSEGSLESTRTTFRDYRGLSVVTVLAGMFLWFLSILLGPLAIYYASKGLQQKKQMAETDGRVGLWIAIVMGSMETIGGATLVFLIAARMFK